MYLQKLEIQGFKSFAHKVTLTFNKGLTAIVGPNGSGKSNVADAVRWVLGEQSMKLLRGKKSEDVIFAGSDKKNRLGAAEVSLFLNNEDGRAPIDASEIVITRRVFRSGESDYLLNGRPTRLTDIALLLAKSNFGQRSYSIIGQGMIDEVLASTPQGRKAFFDEAAGVRAFQIKKEQAQNKLEMTKENLGRVDLLIQEIEPRLRSLTRQVKRLEQRDVVEKELRENQDTYYRDLWHDVKSQLDEMKKKHSDEESKRTALEEELAETEKRLHTEESRSTRNEAFERLQRDYQRLVDEKNSLLREQSSLKGKRDAALSASGQSNVVWIERKLEELDNDLTDLDDAIVQVEREMAHTEETKVTCEKKQERMNAEQIQTENQIVELRKKLQHKAVTIPEVALDLEKLFTKHEHLLKKIRASQSPEHFEALHKEFQAFHQELSQLLDRVKESHDADLAAQLPAFEQQLKTVAAEKERLLREAATISSTAQVQQERKNRFADEREEIESEIASLRRELEQHKAAPDKRDTLLDQQARDIENSIKRVDAEILESRTSLDSFNAEEQKKKDILVALQKSYADIQQQLSDVVRLMNQYAVDIARRETRLEDLEREMRQEIPQDLIEQVKSNKPEPIERGEVYGKIMQLKKSLEMIGGIDAQVQEEYTQTQERFDFLSSQVEDLQKAVADLENGISQLDETVKTRFHAAFEKINTEFSTTFKKLFGGGRAYLDLVKEDIYEEEDEVDGDEDDDEDKKQEDDVEEKPKKIIGKVISGVEIFATPPGKKLKSVGALSGGERALTSIALICAIIANNPSPFVVLDEVEAALDEANSERFAKIIQQLQKQTQFITITHNRATMEHASILYGVTMGEDGISKLLSVNIENAEEIIKQHGNR